MPPAQFKPSFVVRVAPDADPESARISAAARATLPFAFPACDFRFVVARSFELQWSVMPIVGSGAPAARASHAPAMRQLEEIRAALATIVASARRLG